MWSALVEALVPVITPLALILLFMVVVLYRDNQKQTKYARESDIENLKVLKDLKELLAGLIKSNEREQNALSQHIDTNKREVLKEIREETLKLKDHVDARVEVLKEKLDHRKNS